MMNKSNYRKQNSGFTLIEMIVTVSIVAILVSIAAPSFRSMIESNKATAATNELVSALLLARSEALKRRNNVSVCTSDDQTTCKGNTVKDFSKGWIVFQDCNSNGVVDGAVDCGDGVVAETVIKASNGTQKMEILNNRGAGNEHYFSYTFAGRSGGLTTFEVKREGGTDVLREVVISLTGRVKVEGH